MNIIPSDMRYWVATGLTRPSLDYRLPQHSPHNTTMAWTLARREHALLLRCEGLKQSEIAKRLGVTSAMAGQLVGDGKKLLRKAMRHTKYSIIISD